MAIGGLIGLLDDIAALAKLSAASLDDVSAAAGRATVKAAGVVVDDAAVWLLMQWWQARCAAV